MDSIDLASQPKQKLNPNFLKKKKKNPIQIDIPSNHIDRQGLHFISIHET